MIEKHDMMYLNLIWENLVHLNLVQERRFAFSFHTSAISSSLPF